MLKRLYGGSLQYRKLERPLSTTKAVHLTIRSKACKNGISLRSETSAINKHIFTFSESFGLKVYKHAINSNHIHLVIRIKDRRQYNGFIRALTGTIALKFKMKCKTTNFWDLRPFTRLVNWGRDFQRVCNYITKNFKEAVGYLPYSPRSNIYTFLDQFVMTNNTT